MEVARCLTGWTVPAQGILRQWPRRVSRRRITTTARRRVLGQNIPAGGGEQDIDRVLDIVAASSVHRASSRHETLRPLHRRRAASGAVDAVARAFSESRGDIKATLRALFATPEFCGRARQQVQAPVAFRRLRVARDQCGIERGRRRSGADVSPRCPSRKAGGAGSRSTLLASPITSCAWATRRSAIRRPTAIPRKPRTGRVRCSGAGISRSRSARTASKARASNSTNCAPRLGGDAALMATALGRQPTADERAPFANPATASRCCSRPRLSNAAELP